MGNAVFPTLPGLAWSVTKTPQWSTRIQKAVSGREFRSPYYSYPLWKFALKYYFLRAAPSKLEFQQLVGFYNARQGSFDSFLFSDPTDNSVVAAPFGTGNGVTTTFQLARAIGGFTEPVAATSGVPLMYVAGTLTSATVNATAGTVTFASPPANGAALTWTGNFYHRVRFGHDSADFENFMYNLWQAQKIEFGTAR